MSNNDSHTRSDDGSSGAGKSGGEEPDRETPYLSAPEAAHYLRVSISWIRKATTRDEIPCFRIGARVVYDRADLDAFVEERKREAAWYRMRGRRPRGG